MKTDGRRESGNIEDRRGQSAGGRGRMPGMRAGVGGGLGLLVVLVLALFLGVDPAKVIDPAALQEPAPTEVERAQGPIAENDVEAARRRLVAVVLAETEDTWNEIFARGGGAYEEPVLVLFRDAVESACGFAESAAGPFYCPPDRKLFLDLGFFDDMEQKLGAGGDFAMAYVIAHEVGHHVQTLLGISDKVMQLRRRAAPERSNELSVRQELQADCFAGIWARRTQSSTGIIEDGDIEEALNAAAAVGDDRLQRQAQGRVMPETFTHGSSAQRVEWFRRGFQSGELASCDTFNGRVTLR